MGRQWLHSKREVNANKRARITSKLVREITVAAKMGTPDPDMNPRLAMAVEAARKQSVGNDVIQRAIKKGAGEGAEDANYELIVYEGMAPHNVPLLVECMTENRNRTGSDIKSLFKGGQFGSKVMFLFDHRGVVEASHPDAARDLEGAAIEAGAQDVEALEDPPEGGRSGRFLTDVKDLYAVAEALRAAGWTVASAALGYVAKNPVALDAPARAEVEQFLERLDDHDDVQKLFVALA